MPARRKLLAASNRGPFSMVPDAHGEVVAERGGGGLVSAMQSVLAEADGLWICSALNDRERAIARRAHGSLDEAGFDTGDLDVRMLPIDPTTFGRAYNGIANSTLWFINHMLYDVPTKPVFDAAWRRQWASYVRYNAAFAGALADAADKGATVMVQDYHLFLTPDMLRDRRPDVRIGHFTHTPWAPPYYFRMLPDDVAVAVLEGLLGADHLGFHSRTWAENFVQCCGDVLGATIKCDGERIEHDGRVTNIGVHGLGTDEHALRERAGQRDVERKLAELNDDVGDRLLITRVDRSELSKNIVRGLLAYRELLRTRPEWHGKVVHAVYAYPSRSDIPEYREYAGAVQRLGSEIDDEFGTDDWAPLILETGHDYPGSLAAMRRADVMLVNPVRDGMNLVAQEGCILSEPGAALVLSREAGAVGLLGADSLLVNPYDVSGTADVLDAALRMPKAERVERNRRLAAASTALPPPAWFAEQLDAVRRPAG